MNSITFETTIFIQSESLMIAILIKNDIIRLT
jgi:hypothetical protein